MSLPRPSRAIVNRSSEILSPLPGSQFCAIKLRPSNGTLAFTDETRCSSIGNTRRKKTSFRSSSSSALQPRPSCHLPPPPPLLLPPPTHSPHALSHSYAAFSLSLRKRENKAGRRETGRKHRCVYLGSRAGFQETRQSTNLRRTIIMAVSHRHVCRTSSSFSCRSLLLSVPHLFFSLSKGMDGHRLCSLMGSEDCLDGATVFAAR